MRPAVFAVGASLVVSLAACGGSSSTGTTNPGTPNTATSQTPTQATGAGNAPANSAQAIAQIKANWMTFFHTGTDLRTEKALLEDGHSLGGAIKIASKFEKKEKIVEDTKVKSVTFTSPTSATVTYTLLSHGQPLGSPDATGTAVVQDGGWKVSKQTFCGLVGLIAAGQKIPGCS